MSCNLEIHDDLKESGQMYCCFCDKQLNDYKPKQEDSCCDKMELINDKGMSVCFNCSVVNGYDLTSEYIDFYTNQHKFRRKSAYQRKISHLQFYLFATQFK